MASSKLFGVLRSERPLARVGKTLKWLAMPQREEKMAKIINLTPHPVVVDDPLHSEKTVLMGLLRGLLPRERFCVVEAALQMVRASPAGVLKEIRAGSGLFVEEVSNLKNPELALGQQNLSQERQVVLRSKILTKVKVFEGRNENPIDTCQKWYYYYCSFCINSMDNYIKRELEEKLLSWLYEKEIVAVCGPRQSGKTTLVKKVAEDIVLSGKKVFYASFEDAETLSSFIKSPKEFVSLHIGERGKTFFIFDEYQLVPGGGKILKLLFDSFENAKFIITGSSSLKIRDLAESLVGRVIFFELYPLSFSEFLSHKDEVVYKKHKSLQTAFGEFLFSGKFEPLALLYEDTFLKLFEEYATHGGYPAVALSKGQKAEERIQSFINTYVEKDIVKLLRIGNYLDFRNFAQFLSLQIANLVSYSSFGSELGLSFREVKKFLSALEETYVVKSVLPFSKNRATEIKKSKKIYFIDLGLRNGLIGDFRVLELRQDKGAMAENFALQNLLYRTETSDIRYWRTKQGAEVDFVLKVRGELVPIEVKFQNMREAEVSKSLASFVDSYGAKRAVVLTKNFSGARHFEGAKIAYFPIYSV